MRHLKTTLAVLGAVTILVLASNTVAIAATGKGFILGKSNSANKQTTLSRTTNGPVLKLNAKQATGTPLAVRGTGKVVNLNADKLDGLDSTKLGTRALSWTYFGAVPSSNRIFKLTGLPAGSHLLTYEVYMGSPSAGAGAMASCYFYHDPVVGATGYGGEETTTIGAYNASLSGTYLMAQKAGDETALVCRTSAAGGWTAPSTQPLRITAVPLNSVTTAGTPATARVAGK